MKLNAFVVGLLAVMICMPNFAQAAEQPSPNLTLISNVNIFDGKTEKLHKNMHVLVKGNLIETVSNEPFAVIQTDNVTIIEGKGRTLMPGMIEGHGHVMFASDLPKLMNQDEFEQGVHAARRANDYLMSGFTTIRDCGGNSFGVKRALDADIFPGPRIYPGGAAIGQTSGHGDFRSNVDGHPYFDGKENGGNVNRWRHTLIADGVDEVRRAVREQLFRGASHIKIHTGGGVTSFTDPLMAAQYTPEEIKAAVEEATRYGTYVMTHSQMDNSVVASLDAGVKSIEHGLVLEESTVKRMAELGVIKEGAFADILIVNGDPTKDIHLLMDADKNIDLIMKDGKIYKNIIN